MNNDLVIIRGAGDLGTAVAHRLNRCGFRVLMLEAVNPLVIRRRVAFATAVYEQISTVEEISAELIQGRQELSDIWEKKRVAVMVDPHGQIISQLKPMVLVDAMMAKQNMGTNLGMAPITIGLGPGFIAAVDVTVVIETNRGHNLGRLIWSGSAETDTGIPAQIMGHGSERVIRSPVEGVSRNAADIGQQVRSGDLITDISGREIRAPIPGVLRGLIQDGIPITQAMKIADIDPRGIAEYCFTISDKARTISGSVLEAVIYLSK